jgi:hypothetical protein
MGQETKMARYPLRLPKTLYDRVKRLADKENRSINRQLVRLIEEQMRKYEDD